MPKATSTAAPTGAWLGAGVVSYWLAFLVGTGDVLHWADSSLRMLSLVAALVAMLCFVRCCRAEAARWTWLCSALTVIAGLYGLTDSMGLALLPFCTAILICGKLDRASELSVATVVCASALVLGLSRAVSIPWVYREAAEVLDTIHFSFDETARGPKGQVQAYWTVIVGTLVAYSMTAVKRSRLVWMAGACLILAAIQASVSTMVPIAIAQQLVLIAGALVISTHGVVEACAGVTKPMLACLIVAIGLEQSTVRADTASTSDSSKGRIAFVENALADFAKPDPMWSNPKAGPQFGVWRSLLEEAGFKTEVVASLPDQSAMASSDAIVLINWSTDMTGEDMQALHGYLSDGGTIMVLSDHTGIGNQLNATNTFTSEYGITLRFDTAIPYGMNWEWTGGMRFMRHPASPVGITPSQLRWRAGCSLDLGKDAVPIIVGYNAFSDDGDYSNPRGNLGNYRHDRGETTGAIVVAAEARVGKGRLLVFGDTSSFQDSALPTSWPYLLQIVHLAVEREEKDGSPRHVVTWLVVAVALALSAIMPDRLARYLAFLGALLLTVQVGGFASTVTLPVEKSVWIDTAHGNQMRHQHGLYSAISGMTRGLQRFGFCPQLRDAELSPDERRWPRLMVVIAPTTRYSKIELDALSSYVERGGVLWMFVDPDSASRSPELWARFGVSVREEPLGGASDAKLRDIGTRVFVREAWPIDVIGSEPLVTAWERTIVCERRYGMGWIMVAGDTDLFLGEGLEYEYKVNRGNATLFERMLAPVVEQRN